MPWTAYRVILRLHTPMHIGWGKVSYLQRARPYVTGRVLRGALVSRVGRITPNLRITDPRDPYRCVSKTFSQYLTFTYFYPALKKGNDWQAQFPWSDESDFRRRFLSSYAGTALAYPQQSAAEGLLREIEFISPYTLDTGEPVYLMGYIFVDEARLKCEKYNWKAAFQRLQLGGERGYGWGEARRVEVCQLAENDNLFGCEKITFNLEEKRPIVCLPEGAHVLAHTTAIDGALTGLVEPIVGREWHAEGDEEGKRKHIGQRLAFNDIRFAPGSTTLSVSSFTIEKGGYWRQKPGGEL